MTNNPINDAAEAGNLALLRSLRAQGHEWTTDACYLMANNGHLECLRFALEDGCPTSRVDCEGAAMNGHLECLKLLHTNQVPWRSQTCLSAAAGGHLDCLVYAHTNGCPLRDPFVNPLYNEDNEFMGVEQCGTLECLQYVIEHGIHWDQSLYEDLHDHPDMIRYLLSLNKHRPTFYAAYVSIAYGNVESFKYIYESFSEQKQHELWQDSLDFRSIFVSKINLEEPFWRQIFTIDLSANPELQEIVNNKKRQILEEQKACYELPIPTDVIKYTMHKFF